MVAVVAIFLLAAGAGGGSAAIVCFRAPCGPPALELIPNARVSPRNLPSRTPAPIAFHGGARIATPDGSHPPALREATLRVDRRVVIDAVGLPVCGGPAYNVIRDTDDVRKMCRTAIVGSGTALIEVAFPEYSPITVKSEVLVINGGVERGTTTLYVHTMVPIPVPRAVVATVKINRELKRQFVWRVEVAIPPIAGGSGSLRAFNLTVRRSFFHNGTQRSFLAAKCQRGKLEVDMPRAVFRDEASVSGPTETFFTGRLQIPCTPRP